MWKRRAAKLATEENFPSYAARVDKGAEERRKAGSGQDEGRGLDIVPGNWSAFTRTSAGRVLPRPPAHRARPGHGLRSSPATALACLSRPGPKSTRRFPETRGRIQRPGKFYDRLTTS